MLQYQDKNDAPGVVCETCPPNKYITDDKKSFISHQEVGDCIDCEIGYFASAGQRVCRSCAAGKENIDSNCVVCLEGQYV